MKKIELKSVSASKLRLYMECPRKYYYAYGEGIFQKETKSMIFGTYIHSVLELYLKHLLKSRKEQDMEALYAIARNKQKEYDMLDETGSDSFFEADVVLNKFASRKIDPERIYAVEKFFKLSLPDLEAVPIGGRIDRIDVEYGKKGDNLLHIIDYKTGKNEIQEPDLKNDIQMKFYLLGAYYMYRKLHKKFRFTLYYLRNNSQVSFETEFDNEYSREVAETIASVAGDDEYKKKITKQCRFCPAFKVCKPRLKKEEK